MTQEQTAALFHAQCSLRCTVKQLDRDLDPEIASPIIAAIRIVIGACDDAMRPPCERGTRVVTGLRFLPSRLLVRMVCDLLASRHLARRQLAECRATLKAIVDQLAG